MNDDIVANAMYFFFFLKNCWNIVVTTLEAPVKNVAIFFDYNLANRRDERWALWAYNDFPVCFFFINVCGC